LDGFCERRLCEEIILRAVDDFRAASLAGLIDKRGRPVKVLTARQVEMCDSLSWFFFGGGIELLMDFAEIKLPAEKIRRKIIERNR
jgi:hypothetical protein